MRNPGSNQKHPDSEQRSTRSIRRRVGAAAAVALALCAVATTGVGPAPAGADATSASVTVSSTTGLDPAGQTVTITGSGFDPAGHTGTRPPLMGQPSGVYVVFGRFGSPWQPSLGAPSAARTVLTQLWALPKAQHDVFDPDGSNPLFVLLGADGSFSVPLEVEEFEGTGAYGVAVYPASGAINAAQEVLVPVSFAGPTTTTSTTTTSTTTTSTTTTSTTTTTSSTSTTVPTTSTTSSTSTTVPVPPSGSGERSGTGTSGQSLTVSPADDLDPDSAAVRVRGSGYDTSVGIYVALCVDQGGAAAPSPCVGGVDMEGSGSSSAWITSDPPDYGVDLSSPFGAGGSFDINLTVTARDEFVDCLDPATRCVVASRADHTASSDRAADVKVPVYFEGQTPPAGPVESDPAPTTSLGATTVTAGGTLEVKGEGFMPGEQTQVWLYSDPVLLGVVVADDDGGIDGDVTIPANTPPGTHHVELRGLTSGRSARSAVLTVTAAPATTTTAESTGPTTTATVLGATTGAARSGNQPGTSAPLAFTGTTPVTLLLLGASLLFLGALLVRARHISLTDHMATEETR